MVVNAHTFDHAELQKDLVVLVFDVDDRIVTLLQLSWPKNKRHASVIVRKFESQTEIAGSKALLPFVFYLCENVRRFSLASFLLGTPDDDADEIRRKSDLFRERLRSYFNQ